VHPDFARELARHLAWAIADLELSTAATPRYETFWALARENHQPKSGVAAASSFFPMAPLGTSIGRLGRRLVVSGHTRDDWHFRRSGSGELKERKLP
jgi:hypothetical protein